MGEGEGEGGEGRRVPCAETEGVKAMEDIVESTDGVGEMNMGCGRGGGNGGDDGDGGGVEVGGDGAVKVSESMSGEASVGVKSGRFGLREEEWRVEFPRTLTDVFRVWKPAAKRRRSSIS